MMMVAMMRIMNMVVVVVVMMTVIMVMAFVQELPLEMAARSKEAARLTKESVREARRLGEDFFLSKYSLK